MMQLMEIPHLSEDGNQNRMTNLYNKKNWLALYRVESFDLDVFKHRPEHVIIWFKLDYFNSYSFPSYVLCDPTDPIRR